MNRNAVAGLLIFAAALVAFDAAQLGPRLLWCALGGLFVGIGPPQNSDEDE